MNDYLVIIATMVVSSSILFAIFYRLYKLGVATRIFGVAIALIMICSLCGFYVGKENADGGTIALLAVICSVVVISGIYQLHRWIVTPIVELTEMMRRTAIERDLSAKPPLRQRADEIGSMEKSYVALTDSMRDLLENLKVGISQIASSSSQLSSSASESVATASEQASVAAQVSTTVDEINQTSRSTAESAQKVVGVTEEALETDKRVMKSVSDAIDKIESISAKVQSVADKINRLDVQNNQISDIVEAVSDLASQSNLLAVNASIEASRAGEHGRGFSVVASEVRSLADQSKRATRRIQGIISEIRQSSADAVRATEDSRQRSEEGREFIGVVSEFIEELSEVLEQSSSMARQIYAASSQQAAGIKQISEAMAQVRQGGEEMATTARGIEGAITELTSLGNQLDSIAGKYRV